MITFTCLVPHPPLLIPEIGQDNLTKLDQTITAYKHLEHELYVSKPDVILVLTPHGDISDKNFTINQNPKLRTRFKDFGDLVTNLVFDNDIAFGYQIRESCETTLPMILTANEIIDYGTAVPLYYLVQNLKQTKIVVVTMSNISREEHVRLGMVIKDAAEKSNKRVAIVASGDLSHKLHKDSPVGFSVKAQEFDQTIRRLLANKKNQEIIDLDENLILEAGECGYRPLLVLLGIIKDSNYDIEELSYQSPFGIGYLTVNFKLHR